MLLKANFILLVFFIVSKCYGQTYNSKSTFSYWLSSDYLNCLKSELPCKCEKSSSFFLLVLDTTRDIVILHYDSVKNRKFYAIKKDSQTNVPIFYKAYKTNMFTNTTVGQIKINKDTLLYIDSLGKCTKFYSSGVDNGYFNENLRLLNSFIASMGHDKLNKLLKSEKLACLCDTKNGDINVIFDYSQTSVPPKWILEIKNNVLYIYKWKNPPYGNMVNLNQKKKLVQKLKL